MDSDPANSADPNRCALEDAPFEELVRTDHDLRDFRKEYAAKSPGIGREAADWLYHRGMAEGLFGEKVEDAPRAPKCWWEIVALAIDPDYAPAILTVGSIEYHIKRRAQAMDFFLKLPTLPTETADLAVIIDKAGDFLIDQGDLPNAEKLYAAAAAAQPDVALFHVGLGYCVGKAGRKLEAVAHHRRAVELEPESHEHLSDLGYASTEAGFYEEAEEVLTKAVQLAPPDYHLAQGNLDYLRTVRADKKCKNIPFC